VSPSLKTLLPQRGEQAATVTKPSRAPAKAAAKPAAGPAKKENLLVRWWHETESELKKVVWPTRKEWTNLTLAVLVTMVATGMFLGMVDLIFERVILLLAP
jgi:preprotein translocase subunit SecE